MKAMITVLMVGLWLLGIAEGRATALLDESGSNLHVVAQLSAAELEAGETFQVVLAVSEQNNVYYFGAQVRFDPVFIEFVSGEVGGLLDPGMVVAQSMSADRVGASATRTTSPAVPGTGDILILTFRVLEGVHTGQSSLEILDSEARDGDGFLIPIDVVAELSFEVVQGGGSGSGDDGGDGDDGSGDGDGGSDDSGSGGDDGGGEDGSGGGDGGDGSGSGGSIDDPEPDMDIQIESHTMVEFRFEWLTPNPSRSIYNNRNTLFELQGNTYTYANISGVPEGKALRTTGWTGKSDGSQFWHTTISTQEFNHVVLKWVQWGSNTGPRDFFIEAHTGNGEWVSINDEPIIIPSSQNALSNHELNLPLSLWNEPEVTIRWRMATETSINGNSVSNAGTSLIGNIRMLGTLPDESVVVVRPGDTNNDGVVDEADVLALGTYWLSGGPKTLNQSMNWNRRPKQQWVPAMSTFADANGDGMVDYRDLQPIGMFFGRSSITSRRVNRILFREVLDDREETRVRYFIQLPESRFINGLSGKVRIQNTDQSDIEVQVNPLFGSAVHGEPGNLITWKHETKDMISFAWTSKNSKPNMAFQSGSELFELKLESLSGSPIVGEFTIQDLILVDVDGQQFPLTEIKVNPIYGSSVRSGSTDTPQKFELIPAYPNPFNPGTTIGWRMPQPGRVTIKLWDIAGREVMVIADKSYFNLVNYEYIETQNLSSGVYLVTINYNSHVLTQKIMLLK
jgi:hypothetical protein